MALTIVDSDILINVARGDAEAINCCQRLEKSSVLAISAAILGLTIWKKHVNEQKKNFA